MKMTMTEFVLRLLAVMGQSVEPAGDDPVRVGEWLFSFDANAHQGRGEAQFTPNINKAMRFASFQEAANFWKTQSIVRPRRPDGKPNRPLTAFSMTIDPVPSKGKS